MKKILYLLRRRPDRIDESLFDASDSTGDVVLLDGPAFLSATGNRACTVGGSDGDVRLFYDDLVQKIFANDLTIVI